MKESDKKQMPSSALMNQAKELRRELTPQERKLWGRLRNRQLYGLKFRRQHPLGRFILDFYCHEQRLVVEVDGHSHAEPGQERYDRARSEWLEQQGLRVIRFANGEVEANLEGVLWAIARACGEEPSP